MQARTRPTLAPQSASSPDGPPPPTANHHPNVDCTPRTDRIRVPCSLAGPMTAAFAVRGRCRRRRAAASGPGAWATTMACALRPRRARPRRGGNLRRRRRQSWRAQCASEVHFMSACAAAAAVRQAGAYVAMRARIRLRRCALWPPGRAQNCFYAMRVQSDRACMCVHHNSIHSMARTVVGLNYNASARAFNIFYFMCISPSRISRACARAPGLDDGSFISYAAIGTRLIVYSHRDLVHWQTCSRITDRGVYT